MASIGSTIVNRFTSESDDFDVMIALLSSNSFQCYWFANRQYSSIHFPLQATLWELCMIIPTLILSFYTTLRVLASIVLQHYRLWYPGLIPLTVTRSPLYVQTVGGIIYWTTTTLVSLAILSFFRPFVSLGVAHQPHIFSHPPTSRMIVWRGSPELYLLTIFFIGLRPSSMTPNTKIDQLESLYALAFRHTSGKLRDGT